MLHFWLRNNGRKCLCWGRESLARFINAEQALQALAVLAWIEMKWFAARPPTPQKMTCARRNFDGWVRPLADENWVFERALLAEISNRVACELVIQRYDKRKSPLEIALEVVEAAADMSKSFEDKTT